MPKLTIYCVGCRKKMAFKKDEACLYITSNGKPTIRVECKKCGSKASKFIKESDVKNYKEL